MPGHREAGVDEQAPPRDKSAVRGARKCASIAKPEASSHPPGGAGTDAGAYSAERRPALSRERSGKNTVDGHAVAGHCRSKAAGKCRALGSLVLLDSQMNECSIAFDDRPGQPERIVSVGVGESSAWTCVSMRRPMLWQRWSVSEKNLLPKASPRRSHRAAGRFVRDPNKGW